MQQKINFNCFYIDCRQDKYRKNFNEAYEIKNDIENNNI